MAPFQFGAWLAEVHKHATESLASRSRLCKGPDNTFIPEPRKTCASGISLVSLRWRSPHYASYYLGIRASGKLCSLLDRLALEFSWGPLPRTSDSAQEKTGQMRPIRILMLVNSTQKFPFEEHTHHNRMYPCIQ